MSDIDTGTFSYSIERNDLGQYWVMEANDPEAPGSGAYLTLLFARGAIENLAGRPLRCEEVTDLEGNVYWDVEEFSL